MANLSVCCSGANHPEFNFPWRARIARWSCTAFLVSAVWSGSSQAQQSPEATTQEADTAPVEAAPAQNNSGGEIKNRQPKYDIDRIGVRGVGKGINFYSLETEQRLGESLAKRLDRHTTFGTDPSGTDYVNRLAQKLPRNAENEADLLGIEYQYAAGYDPEAYVAALEKLQKREAFMHSRMAKLPGYRVMDKLPMHQLLAKLFAGYPKTEERIRKVQNEIATLLPAKSEYIDNTSEFDEVKARLAWAQRPVLRRHAPGEGNQSRPILRRPRTQQPTSE